MSFYNVNFSGRKSGAIGIFEKFSVELKFDSDFDYQNFYEKMASIRLVLSEFFDHVHEIKFSVRLGFIDQAINEICTREILSDRCRVYETDTVTTLTRYREHVEKH